MTVYFFDSSVLTKRYIIEAGSDWVRDVLAPSSGHTILIAQITPVEVMSAVARHKREKTSMIERHGQCVCCWNDTQAGNMMWYCSLKIF